MVNYLNELINKCKIDEGLKSSLLEHQVTALIAGAGSGKSYSIHELKRNLGEFALVTASTGVAALNVNGMTIHRASGINTYPGPEYLYKVIQSDMWQINKNTINSCELVIIDEVSMLSGNQLTLLDGVFQLAVGNKLPFGGKKILLVGDYLQLPPVGNGKIDWCFNSLSWNKVQVNTVTLHKIWRQDNPEFIESLKMMRLGIVTDECDALFKSRCIPYDSVHNPIKLFGTNKEVDEVNIIELTKIQEEEIYFSPIPNYIDKKQKAAVDDVKKLLHLRVKLGARVMITVNGPGLCYVNGSLGTIEDINPQEISVRLDSDGSVHDISRHEYEIEAAGEIVGTVIQFPIRLGYAVTIHKSQGLSLENVEIDFKRVFAPSQSYVAASRAVSPEGMYLRNWNKNKVFVDETALNIILNIEFEGMEEGINL